VATIAPSQLRLRPFRANWLGTTESSFGAFGRARVGGGGGGGLRSNDDVAQPKQTNKQICSSRPRIVSANGREKQLNARSLPFAGWGRQPASKSIAAPRAALEPRHYLAHSRTSWTILISLLLSS